MTGSQPGNSSLPRAVTEPFWSRLSCDCRFHLLTCVAGLSVALFPVPARAERLEDQIVRIHATKREVDRSSPWQYEEVSQQSYLGVVLGGGRILTSAFAVADAGFLEIQRFGASHRDEATVEYVDYEVNLALIKPVLASALAGTKALELGEDLTVDDAVDIYKSRDAYQLSRMPATLQEVGIYTAVTSFYSLAAYLLKVQQTGLGWAEPVLRQGKLVALTNGQDSNFVHAVPVAIIRHFLQDRHDDSYRGFPALGVQLASLVSPDQRRLLGAAGIAYGVRIAEVQADSSFVGKLREDDVILEVDGQQLSEHGFYTHPKWGKLHMKYLINRHYGGDVLKLKILRQGKELLIEGPLARFDSNRAPVVAYRYGQPEPHLIFGGLVFAELSQDYLKQWGRDWRETGPNELLYTMEYANHPTEVPGTRYVIVARVLADDFNRGYSDVRHQIVDTVNGIKVTSVAGLKAALAHPVIQGGKAYAQIEFSRDGGEAVLAYAGLEAAHQRIAKTYEVKNPASFFAAGAAGAGD